MSEVTNPTQDQDKQTYSEIGVENDSEHLTASEKQLEESFNNWENLSNMEKFACFKLFSKDFSVKFLPVSLVFCIYIITNLANILFVSHSSGPNVEDMLGGVGYGVIIYNMLGVSVCFGLASALDTLCTHAYGAKMYYLMGCYLNRARVILTIVFVPVFFILCFIESILLLINQKPEIAFYAGQFCRGLLPGLWFFYQTDAMRRFLQAQGIYIPTIFIVLTTSLIHPLWLYLFFNVFDWGAFGNGFAASITNMLNFFLLSILIIKKSKKGTYFMLNADSFRGWKEFLAVAIPSSLMICLETWNYQITAIMTGYLADKNEINGNVILLNLSLFFYMFPFGLSVACSNLVGKYVGRFSVKATELSCKMSVVYTLICSFLVMTFLAIVRPWLPYIYTNDEKLADVVKNLIVYYIFYEFFDFLTTSYAGMFRGLGMQNIISVANFICFYVISIPLCYWLTYPAGYGIYGNWTSYIISIVCLVALYSVIYLKKVDFYQICKDSHKRLSQDSFAITDSNSKENLVDEKIKNNHL
jgi:MATE family multidrug resistance protein